MQQQTQPQPQLPNKNQPDEKSGVWIQAKFKIIDGQTKMVLAEGKS